MLSDQVSEYIQGLIGQNNFRAEDAAAVDRRLEVMMSELIRVLIGKFQRAVSSTRPPPNGSPASRPEEG